MFLAAYLAVLSAQFPVDPRAGENKLTQLDLKLNSAGLTFDWQDNEESARGTITPSQLQVGKPLTVSVTLESLTVNELLDGPVTMSLRPLSDMGGDQTVTVKREKDQKSWVAQFTPKEPGPHRIELSWRSTHHKVVRGIFEVVPEGLPRWVGLSLGGGLVTLAVAIGLWLLFGRKEDKESSS